MCKIHLNAYIGVLGFWGFGDASGHALADAPEHTHSTRCERRPVCRRDGGIPPRAGADDLRAAAGNRPAGGSPAQRP